MNQTITWRPRLTQILDSLGIAEWLSWKDQLFQPFVVILPKIASLHEKYIMGSAQITHVLALGEQRRN